MPVANNCSAAYNWLNHVRSIRFKGIGHHYYDNDVLALFLFSFGSSGRAIA